MMPLPPSIVSQQPVTQTPANGEHTTGVLITKDFESEILSIINKNKKKTKFVMFNNDTGVYLKGDYHVQKLRFTKHKQSEF